MNSFITERIVYFVNAVLFIAAFILPYNSLAKSADKVVIIYFVWVILIAYFIALSICFYRSNISKRKTSLFKWVSIIPSIYVFPFLFFSDVNMLVLNERTPLLIGAMIWVFTTTVNLLTKNSRSV